jgi:hypothetical protein
MTVGEAKTARLRMLDWADETREDVVSGAGTGS